MWQGAKVEVLTGPVMAVGCRSCCEFYCLGSTVCLLVDNRLLTTQPNLYLRRDNSEYGA